MKDAGDGTQKHERSIPSPEKPVARPDERLADGPAAPSPESSAGAPKGPRDDWTTAPEVETTPTASAKTAETASVSLFPDHEAEGFRTRWMEIQTEFVDEPRRSVEQADTLVKDVSDRLTSAFSRNRDELERQWAAGDDVSTEDLRRALQRYRSFFERLLSM